LRASDDAVVVEKEWQQMEEEITCSICGDLFIGPKTMHSVFTHILYGIKSYKKMASIINFGVCYALLEMEVIPT